MAQTKVNIHDQQYEFWSNLQKTNPSIYKLQPHKLQYYYISKTLTNKPYQLRLDVYFDNSDHKDKGYQSFTICNVPNGILKQTILDAIQKEFGIKVDSTRYPNCCVIVNWDQKCLGNEPYMIKWFNDHITNLISMLLL